MNVYTCIHVHVKTYVHGYIDRYLQVYINTYKTSTYTHMNASRHLLSDLAQLGWDVLDREFLALPDFQVSNLRISRFPSFRIYELPNLNFPHVHMERGSLGIWSVDI